MTPPPHRASSSPWASPADLLVLHGLRVTGMTSTTGLADRSGLNHQTVAELLLDAEAHGWVARVHFAEVRGWTLTERGRAEDSRRLADELDDAGAREVVKEAHRRFEPLNERLVRACTDWQLRPVDGDPLAVNDHRDRVWDARVLDELSSIAAALAPLIAGLTTALARFSGYDQRFSAALARARSGQEQWVAGVGLASCHAVWMELHEDLLSTLGVARNADLGRK